MGQPNRLEGFEQQPPEKAQFIKGYWQQKPLEDRNLETCIIYLHLFFSQFEKETKWKLQFFICIFFQKRFSEWKPYEICTIVNIFLQKSIVINFFFLLVKGTLKGTLSLFTIAESFYNVKNGLSFITSKSLSKNLSNENKHTMFPENWRADITNSDI